MFPLPVSVAFNPGAANLPGTVTGDGMSRQTCGAITKRTQLGGPKFRGRAYLPYPAESRNDADGNPTSQYKTDAAALGTLLLSPIVITTGGKTITLQPGIYHRPDHTITPVTSFSTHDYWITQRRRARTRPS